MLGIPSIFKLMKRKLGWLLWSDDCADVSVCFRFTHMAKASSTLIAALPIPDLICMALAKKIYKLAFLVSYPLALAECAGWLNLYINVIRSEIHTAPAFDHPRGLCHH